MARVNFTAGRISAFKCTEGKSQAFLWDSDTKQLALRVTPNGEPSFVFQSTYAGNKVRITIGRPAVWSIDDARKKARELQSVIDAGRDPREVKKAAAAKDDAIRTEREEKRIQHEAEAVTVGQAWLEYVAEKSKGDGWGEVSRTHHRKAAQAGGIAFTGRTKGTTTPGVLFSLMEYRLVDLTPQKITAWAENEAKIRATSARLGWRLLRAFLNWCMEDDRYQRLVGQTNPAKTKKARQAIGEPSAKQDALLKTQLPAWFEAVRTMGNPVMSAYLQALLLTGARPSEILGIKWVDVETTWKALTIRDKVEGTRVIPLTPYVHHLIARLPRRNEWVFASTTTAARHISLPNHQHTAACTVAGIDGLTLHGLRRSFKSLSEWLELPAGVVAQIMGHKPSATVERHYAVRPLDLLALHLEKFEAWMLDQAGVEFDRATEPGSFRVVAGGVE
ncbi:integrase family protein [Halothiobacillus sp.]|uniref:tyrosine-type recombinase/integrase n=1 Tax=Halothiobacillus sp. TaxID=1891311 RepID=UPI002AD270B6|nr:integrase family protein [Halothiobacillus sp.]